MIYGVEIFGEKLRRLCLHVKVKVKVIGLTSRHTFKIFCVFYSLNQTTGRKTYDHTWRRSVHRGSTVAGPW